MWAKIISFVMSIYVAFCAFFGGNLSHKIPTSTDTVAVVELVGNPSTGYTWEYNVENEAIAVCSDTTSVSNGKPGMVGASCTFYYSFTGKKAGTTVVTFTYQRAWEDAIPEKINSYLITVDENLNITCTLIEK